MIKASGFIIYTIIDNNLKFLILKHVAGHWGTPKGHRNKKEKSIDCAYREVFEETGISKNDVKKIPDLKYYQEYNVKRKGLVKLKRVTYFVGKVDSKWLDNVKLSQEHIKYSWKNYERVKHKIKYKTLVIILSDIYNKLIDFEQLNL